MEENDRSLPKDVRTAINCALSLDNNNGQGPRPFSYVHDPMLKRLKLSNLPRRKYSTKFDYDVVFIGAGPGGYVGAIKAAQLGLKTACIEKRKTLGGTCLNVGCIPSKALLQNSYFYHLANHGLAKRGISVGEVKLDLDTMMGAKKKSVLSLTSGVAYLFKKNKVTLHQGLGEIIEPNKIKVINDQGKHEVISSKNIVIATGSESMNLPFITVDEKSVVSSTGALELEKVPENLVVIGGGVIGLELGSVWSRLGAKVTVIEFLPSIGAGMDDTVAEAFMKILQKQGLNFRMSTKVIDVRKDGDSFLVGLETSDGKGDSIRADKILLSIGRRSNTDGLGLGNIGIKMNPKGHIMVDGQFRTNIPSVFAIGDVIPGPMLAHKAEEEGIAVAEYLANGQGHVNYDAIPAVIYTHPEVAWVGKTENQVREAGIKYCVGTFPFVANSRAKTVDDAEGFVKVITEEATDKLLGVHIIGPSAGELIAEASLAITYEGSSEDVARTCHAHPTLSEAVKEACLAAHGLKKAINS